ncbi:MAG: FAD binding domain-containing protein [Acidobacteriota bacterium]|nr:FAD binding domain-containing protein [Acidobacteriota bacterium]
MPVDARTLTLHRPRNLKAALAMLASEPTLTPIAGCTDVMVGLHFGTSDQRRFIDLWPLDELRGIAAGGAGRAGKAGKAGRAGRAGRAGQGLRIGALTTYSEIIASPIIRRRVPMLVAAAGEIGGAQIQNRGTLGGNIANGSPAGDTLPVLAAADARIVLRSTGGERRVPFNEFYTGYRTSVRRPDELITAIEIPEIEGRQWWRKVGTRRAQAISKITMAGVHGPANHLRRGYGGQEAGRHIGSVRMAFGSVGPTVVLAQKTARLLAAGGSLAAAQALLRDEIAPIDDVRSTGEYRSQVAANLLAQFWKETHE